MTLQLKSELQSNPLNLTRKEESVFITLNCQDCDFSECYIHPCGRTIVGKEGCTRQVSEDTAARFHHYTQEVIPF